MKIDELTYPLKRSYGTWFSKELFHEMASSPEMVAFSFDKDLPNLVNCRKSFVDLGDLTGYQWATVYLRSWEHMERLLKMPWFHQEFTAWQRELVAKMRSEALSNIVRISKGNTPGAAPASRFVVEEGWNPKTSPGRGRPSKADVQAEVVRSAQELKQESDDLARIGLRVINGDKN